jgi:hypothetical protein
LIELARQGATSRHGAVPQAIVECELSKFPLRKRERNQCAHGIDVAAGLDEMLYPFDLLYACKPRNSDAGEAGEPNEQSGCQRWCLVKFGYDVIQFMRAHSLR